MSKKRAGNAGITSLTEGAPLKPVSLGEGRKKNLRFSGHETFPCRYAWLPKAYIALENEKALNEEEEAMVDLGVGKNMVRAIKFWMQAAEIAESTKGGYKRTVFAREVLGNYDRYLEDIRTLWLLHWKISTNCEEPLFAWEFMLNHWQEPEFGRKQALDAFRREGAKQSKPPSDVTLEHHWETFLHTYYPTRGRKNDIQEDNLDCPLVELELIQKIGERTAEGGKREDIYVFNKAAKPEITPALLTYCLSEFFKRQCNPKTLTFREVSAGVGSVGQIFKLPELDLRERLESIEKDSHGLFIFHESAAQQTVERTREACSEQLLRSIYELEDIGA